MTSQKPNKPGLRRTLLSVAFACVAAFAPVQAQQSPFSTAVVVNDMAITQYEIDQRTQFLTWLRAPGDAAEEARIGLIDDRLRLQASETAGIGITQDDINSGMDEFASRGDLDRDTFIARLAENGISAETFRDFVSNGLIWREFVRSRFGARAQVTEAEIDSALSLSASRTDARVLMSEIILPLTPENGDEALALIQRLSDTIKTTGEFAAAARQYSAAPTRERGGRLEWLPLNRIPPQLRAQVLTLAPGQVTNPVDLGPGVGIFQLRDLEEIEVPEPETLALEYVTISIPGGNSQAARAQAQSYDDNYDTCDDLYVPAQSLSEDQFERVVLSTSEVPSDIALELAKLDDNESSHALTRQNGAILLYTKLCGRTLEAPLNEDGEEVDLRTQIRDRLFQQRLGSYADSFLEELRADAIIIER